MNSQSLSLEEINFAIQSLEALGEDKGEVSDGYHAFNELYEHRYVLYLVLSNAYQRSKTVSHVVSEASPVFDVWKSKLHHDGTMYPGYFILGMVSIYGQISYHLPMKYWNKSIATTLDKGRKGDGHTSDDVLERLLKL